MKLSDYLDRSKLAQYINEGWVKVRKHNTLPLVIYSYSRKTVFANKWDEITTKTRGLIVDTKDCEIIARPYEKFFNFTETITHTGLDFREVEKEFGPPMITEKVNGCLGTFWKYGTHWGIATKGSFHSPHAEFATKWMEDHIEHNGKLVFPEGYTPVFEIICQEIQPHVIKYEHDGLVLLNFVNKDTGEELRRESTYDYAEKNHLDIAYNAWLSFKDALDKDSERYEGYVATFNRPRTTPIKIKIKFPTFLRNRKIFYDELKKKENPAINENYQKVFKTAGEIVQQSLVHCTTRAEIAEYFNSEDNKFYAPACFAMLDYEGDKELRQRIIERLANKLGEMNVDGKRT